MFLFAFRFNQANALAGPDPGTRRGKLRELRFPVRPETCVPPGGIHGGLHVSCIPPGGMHGGMHVLGRNGDAKV